MNHNAYTENDAQSGKTSW